MNRNVQHLTQPVVNKNWFFNLHAEKTSKTLNKQTNSMYLNISETNKKTYTHIKKINLNQSKVNSKYYRLQEIPTLVASYELTFIKL